MNLRREEYHADREIEFEDGGTVITFSAISTVSNAISPSDFKHSHVSPTSFHKISQLCPSRSSLSIWERRVDNIKEQLKTASDHDGLIVR